MEGQYGGRTRLQNTDLVIRYKYQLSAMQSLLPAHEHHRATPDHHNVDAKMSASGAFWSKREAARSEADVYEYH